MSSSTELITTIIKIINQMQGHIIYFEGHTFNPPIVASCYIGIDFIKSHWYTKKIFNMTISHVLLHVYLASSLFVVSLYSLSLSLILLSCCIFSLLFLTCLLHLLDDTWLIMLVKRIRRLRKHLSVGSMALF